MTEFKNTNNPPSLRLSPHPSPFHVPFLHTQPAYITDLVEQLQFVCVFDPKPCLQVFASMCVRVDALASETY